MRGQPVSKYLDISDPLLAVAVEIETALCIDAEFPAGRNLVEKLIELLSDAQKTPQEEEWLLILNRVSAAGERENWSYASRTGRGGNPLGGLFEKYSISSLLLQPFDPKYHLQSKGLVRLFFKARLTDLTRDFSTVAPELRRAVSTRSNRVGILKQLPSCDDYADYCKALTDFLAKVDKTALASGDRSFLRILKSLLPVEVPDSDPDSVPEKITQVKPTAHKMRSVSDGDVNDGIVATFTYTDADPVNDEPPLSALLFVADDLASEAELAPAEQDLDASARESRQWVSRHQRLVPGDQGRFIPPERRRLAGFIRSGISSGDAQQEVASGILGLMYVTGMDLSTVLGGEAGQKGVICTNGLYRRDVKPPADAYRGGPEILELLEPRAEWVDLPLPEPIAKWMRSRCQQTSGSLCQQLGIKPDEAHQYVTEALERLRDHGRFQRIRIERIPAALALELTISQHDPVITYLLSSRINQAAPVLTYYVAHQVETLVSTYTAVTDSMMSQS